MVWNLSYPLLLLYKEEMKLIYVFKQKTSFLLFHIESPLYVASITDLYLSPESFWAHEEIPTHWAVPIISMGE